jgi:hypothetical protein
MSRIDSLPALVLVGLALTGVGIAPAGAQTYHDQTYVFGGLGQTVGKNKGGIYLSTPSGVTTLAVTSEHAFGITTDLDNRSVVFGAQYNGASSPTGLYAGLFRVDPATLVVTTLAGPDTLKYVSPGKIEIDQDGNYLFGCTTRVGTGPTSTLSDALFRLDRNGRLTTVLPPGQLNTLPTWAWQLCKNIDTGHWLVATLGRLGTLNGPIFEVSDGGSVSTWHRGGKVGWTPRPWDGFEQDHQNGSIIGLANGMGGAYLLRMAQDEPDPVLLGVAVPSGPGVQTASWGSALDLQTAPTKRWINYGANIVPVMENFILTMDHQTCVYSQRKIPFGANQFTNPIGGLAIHGRRHIQTLRTGPHRWSILLSCPRSPGYSYLVAAGVSGVRPGVALVDGRRINLRPDPLVLATVRGAIPGLWNPGPGVLNARGEARGEIDLTGTGRGPAGFGQPLWLAMVVLDPAAPLGIRYLPDTYVMRL